MQTSKTLQTLPMPKILLLENDQMQAAMLQGIIEQEKMEVVHLREDSLLLEYIATFTPDLIIVDRFVMSASPDVALGRLIRNSYSTPILFASPITNSNHIEGIFELSNIDYIHKPFFPVEISHRIRRLLKDKTHDSYQLSTYCFRPAKRTLLCGGETTNLTHTEAAVLHLLCKQLNDIVPRETIIQEVWRIKDGISKDHSLNNIILSLRKYFSDDEHIEIICRPRIGVGIIVHK